MDHRDVYLNFIHGQWRQGSTGLWDDNRNPARPSELLGKATRSNPGDIEKAIESAYQTQKEWTRRARSSRAAILQKAANILKAKLENHAKAVHREHGMTLSQAREEIARAQVSLDAIASQGRASVGSMLPTDGVAGSMAFTSRMPVGVVTVIASCASPMASPAREIGAALLEGNTVIFKPSTLTPGTAAILVRTLEEAGIPPGTLNLIYGSGTALATPLIQDRRIQGVAFCGSTEAGLQVSSLLSRRRIKARLETGRRDVVVVTAGADLAGAAQFAAAALHGSTSLVIVEESVHVGFREQLLERVRSFKTGEPTVEGANVISPLCSERHLNRTAEFVQACVSEGATLLCGGEKIGLAPPDSGYYYAPTVLDGIRPEMKLAREDFHGPVLGIQTGANWEGIAQTLLSSDRFHAVTVFAGSGVQALSMADQIPASLLSINPAPTLALAEGGDGWDATCFTITRRVTAQL